MFPTPVATLLALSFTALSIVGCGGEGADAPANQEPSASSSPTVADAPPKNACALIDLEAMEGITGQKLTMLHNIEDETQSTCELSTDRDQTTLIYLTVHWSGGRELGQANQTAMGMGKQMLNEPDVDIEALTGSGAVEGLADAAFYSDIMPSWVLKDDVLIEILSPRFEHARTSAVFTSAAKTALSRL